MPTGSGYRESGSVRRAGSKDEMPVMVFPTTSAQGAGAWKTTPSIRFSS